MILYIAQKVNVYKKGEKSEPNKKGHDGRGEGDTRGGLVDCIGSNRNAGLFPSFMIVKSYYKKL